MLAWARALAEHRGVTLASLGSLDDAAVAQEAALLRREWIGRRATSIRSMAKKERTAELERLVSSDDIDDRYVADAAARKRRD